MLSSVALALPSNPKAFCGALLDGGEQDGSQHKSPLSSKKSQTSALLKSSWNPPTSWPQTCTLRKMKEIVSDLTGISPLQECGRKERKPLVPLGAWSLCSVALPVCRSSLRTRSPDRVSLSWLGSPESSLSFLVLFI